VKATLATQVEGLPSGTAVDLKRDLSRLDEVYRDEVIERVVPSRTNADGEVEFVDPQSMLKLVKNE
jgi:hypothetical protein